MNFSFNIETFRVRTFGISSPQELENLQSLDLEQKMPKLQNTPMMLSRRLSAGSRQAVDLGAELLKDPDIQAYVYASRHGEMEHNVNILSALANAQDVSPTDFTVSVHNAAAATASIISKRHLPYSCLSNEQDSFIAGLIEAYTFLKSGCRKVLLVDFDNTIPSLFKQLVPDNRADLSYAVALVLSLPQKDQVSTSQETFTVDCSFSLATKQEPQAPQETKIKQDRPSLLPQIPSLLLAWHLANSSTKFALPATHGQWNCSIQHKQPN